MSPLTLQNAVLPPPIKPGDTIGYFSPSSPATYFAPKRYQRARDFLLAKGYQLKSGHLSGQTDYYRSGSIADRVAELNDLIRNPDVRCIMSTIGGSNSNSMLPYIDYEALKRDPKVVIGYSDATAILLGIQARTNLITFYGPALVASFGEFPPLVDETFTYFEEITQGRLKPNTPLIMPKQWTDERISWEDQDRAKLCQQNTLEYMGEGIVRGRLMGGNLNTMWGIWGSPYMPTIEQGDILLIEDSLKSIAVVERLFAFLSLNGIFERVGAIVLGKHELFDDAGTGRQPIDVLREVLGSRHVPILHGFDCCHTHPMLTVPIGCTTEINFDQGTFKIVEPWVSDMIS